MAGNLKPNDDVIESTSYSIVATNMNNGLFDGTISPSGGGYGDFRFIENYIVIQLNENCNIWRFPLRGYPTYNDNILDIFRYENGEYINITANYTQSLSSTDWTILFKNLPKGQYKIQSKGGNRYDAEWFIERIISIGLLKQNNNYYSIKEKHYNETLKQYEPLSRADMSEGFVLGELFNNVTIGLKTYDLTPIMTSNTTPSPYIVSSSSIFSTTYPAWNVFSSSNVGEANAWLSANNTPKGWIALDFNTPKTINQLTLTSRNYSDSNFTSPKVFALEGSDNGTDFTVIKSFTETSWANNETKIFILDNDVTYRHYRINITENNGAKYSAIGKIKFIYNEPLKEQFKPIDKFNNFQLVTETSDVVINIKGLKYIKQLIVANDDIPSSIASNIDYFTLTESHSSNSLVKLVLSIDNGKIWKTFNSTTSLFEDLPNCTIPLKAYNTLTPIELQQWDTARDIIYEKGISSLVFNTLDFNQLNSKTIRFAYALLRPTYSDIAETKELQWKFDAKGSMRKMTDAENYVDIYENQIKVTPLIDNALVKVNVMV